MKRLLLFVSAAVVSALCSGLPSPALADKGPAPAPGTPTAQIRATNDRIDKLLKSKKSADDPAARSEMRAIVNGFLDYDELARRSLARHWDGLTKVQQGEFSKTLHDMIEKSYEKRLKTDLDYKVSYGSEAVKGDDATVATMVKVKTKGKSTETAIDYKLKKSGERWVVYDVVTDEVSMVKTYREQFDKIIQQETFDGLLKKMRKRIAETEHATDDKKASTASK